MSQKLTVRPTKPVAIMGLVVAIAMFVFGIFFLSAVLGDSGGEPGPVIAFMALWFIALGVIIAYFIYNLRSRKGVIEIDAEGGLPGGQAGPDFDDRLRKLEGLKKDGLITDEEYRSKRAEVLGEKW
jgi:Zn-dependent protease with chaperone function